MAHTPLQFMSEDGSATTDAVELSPRSSAYDAHMGELDNGYRNVPSVFLPVTAVDKNNLLQTVVEDGFRKFEDVYRNVPVDQRPQQQ